MQFELYPAEEGRKERRYVTTLHLMIALLLCGVGAAAEMLFWFTSVSPNFQSPYLPFGIMGGICIFAGIAILALTIMHRKQRHNPAANTALRIVEIALLSAGSIVFLITKSETPTEIPATLFAFMATVSIFALIYERKGQHMRAISINDKGIILPARMKYIAWKDIERVLLRHNILTIEGIDNKRWQVSVRSAAFEQEDLEIFVAAQIVKHKRADKPVW